MNQHVPEDLLTAFVDGEVTEQVAVHIAMHLDECPSCATRAAACEPLGPAFAAVRDPSPPPHLSAFVLSAAVLARASEPERFPMRELWFGGGLLVAASAALLLFEGPIRLTVELARLLHVGAALTRGLSVAVEPNQMSLLLGTFVTLVGSLLTLYFASTHLLDGRDVLRRIR